MDRKEEYYRTHGKWGRRETQPQDDRKDLDPTKHYAKINGQVVEYTRLSYFKDSYSTTDGTYLGSGGIYVSYGNLIEAALPSNREVMHFWK